MALRMTRKTGLIVGAVTLVVASGAGTAIASGDDDATEQPITGSALEKATDAALAETGEGTVTGTESGDEDSMYEVEVTLDNGDQVDVQLDEDFHVVSAKEDVEEGGGS